MIDKKLMTDYLLKESRRQTKEIIKREIKVKVIPGKVISIIGPRRAGKTYFLYKLRERFPDFLHMNFEHIAFERINTSEIPAVISLHTEIFGRKAKVLFLDEVEELEGWEKLVRSLLDSGEYLIFISGSSSKLLSREIATQLRGRTLSYILLPFSFREFLQAKNITIKKFLTLDEEAILKRELKNYLDFGGYPEVVLEEKEYKERILREYFTTILYRDFVERFGLENIELARMVFEFAFQNFAKEFSVRKILSFIGVKGFGKTTLYKYVEKLPETFSIFFVERFSKSIYQRKTWPKKVYVCDFGISKILGFEAQIGRKIENTVFLDLLRGVNENPLRTIYFYKSKEGHEIDFVVKEGAKIKQLIQACHNVEDLDVKKRELRALLKGSEELGCNKLLVITWDYENMERYRGKKVEFVPLWKWLSIRND